MTLTEIQFFKSKFYFLGTDLIAEILEVSTVGHFKANTTLITEGQHVKVIPIVLKGLVKVFTQIEDKELLLYYMKAEQSCIVSFASSLKNETSRIFAITEEDSTLLLLPSDKVVKWVTTMPAINLLFYQQYDLRYGELIDAINRMLYFKLDKRLMDYLVQKVKITGKNPVRISHKEIANELGTAREVVSRLIKKFESQNLVRQHRDQIEILTVG
ncbi:MAG: Crp/Fnr family transcriptional regulator [Bacteroidales bacterium]|nr:Crp/Fnr family transcriptional regulator [Bacteroidales bacterium]